MNTISTLSRGWKSFLRNSGRSGSLADGAGVTLPTACSIATSPGQSQDAGNLRSDSKSKA